MSRTVAPIAPAKLAAILREPWPPRDPISPRARGYGVGYMPGEVNHCPGCGRSHWYIGRKLAECGFCATAIPLLTQG